MKLGLNGVVNGVGTWHDMGLTVDNGICKQHIMASIEATF